MKKLFSLLLALLLCLSLAGCGNAGPAGKEDTSYVPPRPEDCSLEFWIADSVEPEDFSGHDEVDGMFGGWEYLGKGYHTVKVEGGMNAHPDVYVSYIVTAYPDYSSPGSAVTTIVITDPAVTVYGLTVNSPLEEWDAVMREMGFEISDPGGSGTGHHAERDGFWFSYGYGEIRINAEVTNEQGIIF